MTFSERMMELLDQGVAASMDFAVKAGAKAQEMGERGILSIEIRQLENQAQKLLSRLGNETFRAFAENNRDKIEKSDPEISSIIGELFKLREAIDQKEAELRSRRN